jgi:hypothetical protein
MGQFNELPIPDMAKKDPKSFEILRVWMTGTGQYVILKPGVTSDPAGWGLVIADVMRHLANAYEQAEGRDKSTTFERIRAGLEAELSSPTDRPRGSLVKRPE